jgi:tripartite-type tricarboxylate transporter receptor subunit TctC
MAKVTKIRPCTPSALPLRKGKEKIMKRRLALAAVFSLLFVILIPALSFSQAAFPSKPIQILIGYAPGGSTDVLIRALAQESKKYLGQEVVIVNKPGSAGSVAAAQVAAASPDGYTLGASPSSTFTVNPFLQDLQVDLINETISLLSVAKFNVAVFVKNDSPFKSLKELIEYARQNPGKVTYGNPGVGTRPHLVMAMVTAQEQIKMNLIPFPGDGPTVTALLGGHLTAAGCSAGGWVPHVQAGSLRLLAVAEEERIEEYGNIPTLIELGYPHSLPLVVAVFGPKGLPEPIATKLVEAFDKASKDPVFIDVATKNSLLAKKNIFREDLARFLMKERTSTGEIIQKLGLKK